MPSSVAQCMSAPASIRSCAAREQPDLEARCRGVKPLLSGTALCSYKTAKTRILVFKVEFHPLFTVTTIKTRLRLATALNYSPFTTIPTIVLAISPL